MMQLEGLTDLRWGRGRIAPDWRVAERVVSSILQEFLIRKLTPSANRHAAGPNDPDEKP
jgi:hypothetical protein